MPLQQHSSSSQTGLIILLLVAIIGAGGWFALKPAYSNYGQAKTLLKETQVRLEEKKNALANMDSLINDYENNQQRIKVLEAALPKELESAQILSTLESLALQNGLLLTNVSISDERTENLAQQQIIPATDGFTSSARQLNTALITVALAGSHEGFSSWVRAAELNLRLFDIQLLSASPGETAALEFNVQFNIYYQ